MPRIKPILFGLFALIVAALLYLMIGGDRHAHADQTASATGKWTCSMCPQFILPEPGKCPKCFMDLIPLEEGYGGGKLEIGLRPEAVALAGIDTAIAEKPLDDESDDAPILIPATAVLENVGRSFVYTESTDGEYAIFMLREIVPGPRRGNMLEVASGLDEGEAVVSKGAFRIDSAMQILGKISLVNIPDGDLADAADDALEEYQPAERSDVDPRRDGIRMDDWFGRYEAVRAALAKDDLPASVKPALAFATEVAQANDEVEPEFASLRQLLADHLSALTRTDSLDARRDGFEKVTADMTLLARRYGSPKGGLNLIYCPMAFGGAGAYWLQPQETVDNPYHGLEMPLCGWRVDTISE